MSTPVISVDGLGKRYRIGLHEEQVKSKSQAIAAALGSPFSYLRQMLRSATEQETLWAVRKVSFEVEPGEVIGIVGRNGAGKSTLLKILSRITDPTEGRARLRGRVGSLLEVGTGFHPDLTGRDNIFLSGTILGMRKKEIERKFDEIVSFADIDKFVDTPVKRYSSGMYVRLAFAVAAHLEAEILLVDEVLAVGDLAFQKKCLGKMESVTHQGRTVLFVSHNMQTIRALCPRTLYFAGGRLKMDAPTHESLTTYYGDLRQSEIDAETELRNPLHRRGSGAVRFTKINIQDASGGENTEFGMGSTVQFILHYKVLKTVEDLSVKVLLRSGKTHEPVTSARHVVAKHRILEGAEGILKIELPDLNLRPGEYPLYFWLGDSDGRAFDVVDDLTAPLVIFADSEVHDIYDFDPSRSSGFFNIESRMFELSPA